jgi:hypothetical protein
MQEHKPLILQQVACKQMFEEINLIFPMIMQLQSK